MVSAGEAIEKVHTQFEKYADKLPTPTQRNREFLRRNREFECKNREFEPGTVQIDFRTTFSEGTPGIDFVPWASPISYGFMLSLLQAAIGGKPPNPGKLFLLNYVVGTEDLDDLTTFGKTVGI